MMMRRRLTFALASVAPAPQKAAHSTNSHMEFDSFMETLKAISSLHEPKAQEALARRVWDAWALERKGWESERQGLSAERDSLRNAFVEGLAKSNVLMGDKDKTIAHKDKIIEMKEELIASVQERLADAEAKLLMLQAKEKSVCSFRPIIEHNCLRYYGRSLGLGLGDSVSSFIAKRLQQEGATKGAVGMCLSPQSKSILDALGVSDQGQEEVALALSQQKFILNQPLCGIPYLRTTHPTGFVLGGPAPVRYATALVLLKLQEICLVLFASDTIPQKVFLLDDNDDEVTHVLRNGVVVKYMPQLCPS